MKISKEELKLLVQEELGTYEAQLTPRQPTINEEQDPWHAAGLNSVLSALESQKETLDKILEGITQLLGSKPAEAAKKAAEQAAKAVKEKTRAKRPEMMTMPMAGTEATRPDPFYENKKRRR